MAGQRNPSPALRLQRAYCCTPELPPVPTKFLGGPDLSHRGGKLPRCSAVTFLACQAQARRLEEEVGTVLRGLDRSLKGCLAG